jgi:hypothetical protein
MLWGNSPVRHHVQHGAERGALIQRTRRLAILYPVLHRVSVSYRWVGTRLHPDLVSRNFPWLPHPSPVTPNCGESLGVGHDPVGFTSVYDCRGGLTCTRWTDDAGVAG